MRPRALLFATCLFCLALHSTAGLPAVSVLSTFARGGGPVPAKCSAQVDQLDSLLKAQPELQDWAFLIACDEAAWNRLLARIDQNNRAASLYAVTSLAGQTTCLRGSMLLDSGSPSARAQHVLAHELAHILAHTRNEVLAEQQARAWRASAYRRKP